MFVVKPNQEAKYTGEGSLEWTVVGKGSGRNYKEVEEKAECRETDDHAGNNLVGDVEVVGEGVAQEEESGLEHQGWTLHHKVELPGDHPVHLALPVSAAFDDGFKLHRSIAVQPLLSHHGNEGGEEGD